MKKPKTQSELAKMLGITCQALNWHVKKPGAPAEIGDVEGWQRFLAEVGREETLPQASRAKIAAERAGLLRAQRIKVETENAVRAKDLMSFSAGRRQAAEAMAIVVAEQQRMENELPTILKGLGEIEIQAELKKAHASARKKWQELFDRIGDDES
jgi:hypothetical protein